MLEDAVFEISQPLPLSAGEIILLATDGLKEAYSPEGAQLGIEPVLSLLRASSRQSATATVDALFAQMQAFIAGKPTIDDATAVVVKCRTQIDSQPAGHLRPPAAWPLEAESLGVGEVRTVATS